MAAEVCKDCPASRIVCGNTNKQKSVGNPADEIAIVRLDFKVFYGYWVLRIALRYAARVWPDDSQEIISHWRFGGFLGFLGIGNLLMAANCQQTPWTPRSIPGDPFGIT